MGYPLWGLDLDQETTPFEARLGWVVDWDHDFVGRSALLAQEKAGPGRSLVAIATEGRSVPRHGSRVRSGASAGTVTSGNFSPTLGHGIALAYLTPPIEPGADTDTEVEIRGTWKPARITRRSRSSPGDRGIALPLLSMDHSAIPEPWLLRFDAA